jgi:hypothetical protein
MERVDFVPRFFFSRIVTSEVGENLFGGVVSFSCVSILSIFTLPFKSGRVDSSILEG